ncbi:hypothetical protein F5Y15DRAFT_425368 [Xylariaceae sp. FL0016]|nr:hypothetical protein F5Y15DRAFT_425368 [Xylariaceae sp. FL0016]
MKSFIPSACLVVSIYALDPWRSLNSTLDGRLQKSIPVAASCFTSYAGTPQEVDQAACQQIREDYTLNEFRTNHAESYMNLQSEMCLSMPADQCVLDSSISPAGMPSSNATCKQGSVPSYFVEVKDAADVVAAFDFAKKNDVAISIKNSGHDYMLRNSGKGSLNLWTHKLQGISHINDFVPQGCNETVGSVIVAGAGVDVDTAYHFADKHGSTILGPYAPSVTISTGWVMGAGHSVLSPVYGLGADRVVEFHIVTPDGQERIVNACQNSDLFWALRGGGGGSFGVVLSATHRVEPRMPIAFADIHLPSNATSGDALDWVALLLEESLQWGIDGWGGHVGGTFVTHFNPLPALTGDNGTKARAAFQRASDFALKLGGTSNVAVYESFIEPWDEFLLPQDSNLGGRLGFTSSRLLPTELFADEAGRQSIIDYMKSAQALGFDPLSFYTPVTTPFVADESQKDIDEAKKGTSVTPAWYGALWHFETSARWSAWDSSYAERLEKLTALTNVTKQSEVLGGPNGGSYYNEANPFTQDWQNAWWGENYERLVETKKKYDPDTLLKCWKCVGFEEEDVALPRFSCQGKIQMDINLAFP